MPSSSKEHRRVLTLSELRSLRPLQAIDCVVSLTLCPPSSESSVVPESQLYYGKGGNYTMGRAATLRARPVFSFFRVWNDCAKALDCAVLVWYGMEYLRAGDCPVTKGADSVTLYFCGLVAPSVEKAKGRDPRLGGISHRLRVLADLSVSCSGAAILMPLTSSFVISSTSHYIGWFPVSSCY